MLGLILSIQLLTNGIVKISIPPTNPDHIYTVATSTNLTDWNDFDSTLFYGSTNNLCHTNSITQPQEYFRLEDLDELYDF